VVAHGRFERHIKPLLGTKRVIELTRADVVKFIRDVTAGKTAVHNRKGKNGARILVTGGPGTAARTAGLLGAILTYAVGEGIIEHNPAASVPKPADNVRTRRLGADEYRTVGKLLSGAEFETPQAITGAWLLALTGCRLGEIVNLTWGEVDETAGCFRLKDSKTGPSIRPIGKEAFDVLREALRIDGNPYVLPAVRKDGSYNGLSGAWLRLMKQAGLEDVTPHTMRHSYASVAGDVGMSDSTISSLLGHSSGTVTSKYVHRLDSVLVAAANKVCGEIFRKMTGKGGNVIEMPRRA
jgi:integrase